MGARSGRNGSQSDSYQFGLVLAPSERGAPLARAGARGPAHPTSSSRRLGGRLPATQPATKSLVRLICALDFGRLLEAPVCADRMRATTRRPCRLGRASPNSLSGRQDARVHLLPVIIIV